MSRQEIIEFEYENMRRSRNSGRLSREFRDMTNQELYSYVCKKWEIEAAGSCS